MIFADLFFKNMNIGWFEFIDNLFYDLIKKLSNAKIPIFLVRDKILFFSETFNVPGLQSIGFSIPKICVAIIP